LQGVDGLFNGRVMRITALISVRASAVPEELVAHFACVGVTAVGADAVSATAAPLAAWAPAAALAGALGGAGLAASGGFIVGGCEGIIVSLLLRSQHGGPLIDTAKAGALKLGLPERRFVIGPDNATST